MKLLSLILLVSITGCTGFGNLPSVQNCQKVSYTREGNQIKITADCSVPIQKMDLPVPLPAGVL